MMFVHFFNASSPQNIRVWEILKVTLPKREEAKARKIEIKGVEAKPLKVEKAKA